MRDKHGTPLQTAPEWQSLLSANSWATLEALFAVPNDAGLSKAGLPRWRERLRCTLRDSEGRERVVFLKRFWAVPLGEQVKRWLNSDPNHGTAWTEWTWLQRLAQVGIAAATPIAFGEHLTGPWERCSAILMAAVPGASLEKWCDEYRQRLPFPLQDALADAVRRFHSLGLVHRDLYLAHLFCDDPQAAAPRVSIIDLQRVRRIGWRRRRWIVKDLASLNYSTPDWAATPRDRLRWMKRYLGISSLAPAHRVLIRLIVGKTERIRRHDSPAGRSVSIGGIKALEGTTPGTESVAAPGLDGYDA